MFYLIVPKSTKDNKYNPEFSGSQTGINYSKNKIRWLNLYRQLNIYSS